MTKLHPDDISAAHAEYFPTQELVDDIARRYDVTRRTLHYRFRQAGLPIRPRPNRPRVALDPGQLAEAAARHSSGEALDDIAYDLHVSPVTLSRKLRQVGHDTRRRPRGRLRANAQGEQALC